MFSFVFSKASVPVTRHAWQSQKATALQAGLLCLGQTLQHVRLSLHGGTAFPPQLCMFRSDDARSVYVSYSSNSTRFQQYQSGCRQHWKSGKFDTPLQSPTPPPPPGPPPCTPPAWGASGHSRSVMTPGGIDFSFVPLPTSSATCRGSCQFHTSLTKPSSLSHLHFCSCLLLQLLQ